MSPPNYFFIEIRLQLQAFILIGYFIIGVDKCSVSTPTYDCLHQFPYAFILPIFAEYICWIVFTTYMIKTVGICCNRFTNSMEGYFVMTFMEFCMKLHSAIDNRLGITKYLNWANNRYSKISECCPRINNFSTYILAATNSEEYVAILALSCFLDHHCIGLWLIKCKIPVTSCLVRTSWYIFAST